MYPVYDIRGNGTWTEIDGVTTKVVSAPPLGNWRGQAGSLKVEYTGACENKSFEIDGRPGTLFTVNAEIVGAFGSKHVTFYEFLPNDLIAVTITEAAALARTTEQSVRDVLRDDKRRAEIFPSAYRLGSIERGEWRLRAEEVLSWKPRRNKLDEMDDVEAFYGKQGDLLDG